jgi:signal recognition particle receptor subunit alpha
MASLDFSVDKEPSNGADFGSHDLQSLVDQSSLGTRTRDGMYEVRDWDFSRDKEADADAADAIAKALKPVNGKASDAEASLGTFGSIFARLTGSKVFTEADLKPVLDAMKQHLMKKNVAMDIADKVCEGVGESLIGKKVAGFQSNS